MKTSLDYKKDFLCVLAQFEVADELHSHTLVKEWYPIQRAEEAEAKALVGRPVTAIDSSEGIFVDEEGNVFELASGTEKKLLDTERVAAEPGPKGDLTTLLEDSLRKVERSRAARASGPGGREGRRNKSTKRRKRKDVPSLGERSVNGVSAVGTGVQTESAEKHESSENSAPLNLKQKLAVVRRRLGYIQKRGHNERHNYSYVTAADLAGAVGDILAELGVVVIPRLESISHEPVRSGRADAEHLTHVVMNYSFVDVDTTEEITVKVAGEGLDQGDKAPYKAMTGALKYALLQSFLLATGDDPEDERANHSATSRERNSDRLIAGDKARELHQLVEDTATDLERMLAYYKLGSLEEMTEGVYRRAVDLLNRKKAKQSQAENAHAQD